MENSVSASVPSYLKAEGSSNNSALRGFALKQAPCLLQRPFTGQSLVKPSNLGPPTFQPSQLHNCELFELEALSAALFFCVLSENVANVVLSDLMGVDNDILCELICRVSVGSESKLELRLTFTVTPCHCQQRWWETLTLSLSNIMYRSLFVTAMWRTN